MNDACGGNSPLSLQDKLDRISHDRDVLAQLRDLARQGLHDGDPVRHRASGASDACWCCGLNGSRARWCNSTMAARCRSTPGGVRDGELTLARRD